ncbi:NADH dehydrogenase [ubiquinone] 1 beta subcomplex subunit 1 [Vulpes vulpes]|uniref:NADH dehydrogenase [ubiquinone] 1 beta subcomplex subunit 1 n=1 Tax=Vulpes vulpes TaxID=9627 RepID=A0A3Q7R7F9_VULVU|nr:NADH dehydrogenase [ubiquinone] 1 beta subcomplex subunit 1 [Vulpes vulpes]XP_041614839.1 NADH dehydrogenase [ubiquinone] 1 beta subcomplex subunit 1 [Vulpes lagopus]
MARPKAAASAGAGGWARGCPWSRGRWSRPGAALKMNVIQIVRDHWVHIFVPMGFVLGCYLDRKNDEKLTAFRNKSLLFRRELRPNEEVTWK